MNKNIVITEKQLVRSLLKNKTNNNQKNDDQILYTN